jgi:Capsule polysaccharide biosynthesis protein
VVSLFSNIAWDSAVVGAEIAYPSMLDWISDAVRTAGELEGVVLVVRIHPAERRWGTRQPIESAIGEVPANVRVIAPGRELSSYALLELSDLVLTYTTTVGLEAAVRGIPVAVAGRTHYRSRGFTHDLESPDQLRSLLRSGEWGVGDDQAETALRYAHLFFFRFCIPFPAVPIDHGVPSALPQDLDALRPGADPYLDFVCERILDAGDFALPDELAV